MAWSQALQSGDGRDQMTILIGSAIRLLCGEAGVFVVAREAFDPLSGDEFVPYRLSQDECARLLAYVRGRPQPGLACPLLVETLPPVLVPDLGPLDVPQEEHEPCPLDSCALLVYDQAGIAGKLYFLRLAGRQSCFEHSERGSSGQESQEALPLFIAHVAAGVRASIQAQLLLKEQNRLSAVIQQSAEGILTVDTALRIVDFNPAMERLTGWLESEVLGRYYYEVLLPQDRQGKALGAQDSLILQAFASRGNVQGQLTIAARDGQRFDVSVTASSVRSSKDEVIGGILTLRDITREREEEERRSTFISVISHELQTPIAIIKGYASTLARADAPLDQQLLRRRLQAVEEEADRLNKLVSNLLYASRIQAGGLQMEIAPLDLSRLIQRVALRLRVKSPGVTVRLDLAPNLPTVMADRDRIEEVLENLLDNAVKYSPHRRVITVAARPTSDEVIVSVSDEGMGISLRDQEEIFERFRQAGGHAGGQARATQGAGLGLYICRAIVEAHGGHIRVESVLHQGSTFSFSLPREQKALVPMVVF
jgi:PAS domain S-box-containing protein